VVGWSMQTHLRTELILAALNMALTQQWMHPSRCLSPRGCIQRMMPTNLPRAAKYAPLERPAETPAYHATRSATLVRGVRATANVDLNVDCRSGGCTRGALSPIAANASALIEAPGRRIICEHHPMLQASVPCLRFPGVWLFGP
jgi:hypothetical protein